MSNNMYVSIILEQQWMNHLVAQSKIVKQALNEGANNMIEADKKLDK